MSSRTQTDALPQESRATITVKELLRALPQLDTYSKLLAECWVMTALLLTDFCIVSSSLSPRTYSSRRSEADKTKATGCLWPGHLYQLVLRSSLVWNVWQLLWCKMSYHDIPGCVSPVDLLAVPASSGQLKPTPKKWQKFTSIYLLYSMIGS